ncbi:MAG TPA: biosynthetic peptidoglycan transglycosylase, partial [Geobacteraceae bacterium]|nr:biosynthetic peptidoglycan transglycosylase [Geobacteraceae bacterium]
QLAKNIYLSREKTLTRKLKELYLALRMEQELTKGRILELYLNVVELGPMVYGVGHASHYYFGKTTDELTPREAAFLIAMLPGPRVAYNPYRNMGKVLKRSDVILKLLRAKNVLSGDEYAAAIAVVPNVNGLQRKVDESIKKEDIFVNQSSSAGGIRDEEKPAEAEKKEQAVPSPAADVPAPAGKEGAEPARTEGSPVR